MPEKRKKQAAPAIMGRPTDYSQDLADEICDRIASGQPLVRICKDEHMPHVTTVYRWLNKRADFCDMYTKAKDASADTLAEEIQDIADSIPMETTDKEGNTKFDPAYINWMRLRVDARKWVAAKLKPRKYGDRLTHAGDAENPIKSETTIQASELFASILQNMELKKQQSANER